MSHETWMPPKEVVVSFAGSPYYVTVQVAQNLRLQAPCCCCQSPERRGHKIKVWVRSVLNKSRKDAGHHAKTAVLRMVMLMCRDGRHLCHECIRLLPFPAEMQSS